VGIHTSVKKKKKTTTNTSFIYLIESLMVHMRFNRVALHFIHTDSTELYPQARFRSATVLAGALFSFRVKVGTFIQNLIFNPISGSSFLDS